MSLVIGWKFHEQKGALLRICLPRRSDLGCPVPEAEAAVRKSRAWPAEPVSTYQLVSLSADASWAGPEGAVVQ